MSLEDLTKWGEEGSTKQLPRQMVDHPPHYTSHPSGVECITITRHMGSNLGNALKYIWRCDLKHDAIEDLEKAIFYLRDEIKLRWGKLPKTEYGDSAEHRPPPSTTRL